MSCGVAELTVALPLTVYPSIGASLAFVTPPSARAIVPVVVIVPPVIGYDVATEVTPGAGYCVATYCPICCVVICFDVPACTASSCSVPFKAIATGRLGICAFDMPYTEVTVCQPVPVYTHNFWSVVSKTRRPVVTPVKAFFSDVV